MDICIFEREGSYGGLWRDVALSLGGSARINADFDEDELVRARDASLLIIDQRASIGTIVESVVKARAFRPQQEIVVTGDALTVSDVARMMHSGVADVLGKPFQREDASETLIRVIERVRQVEAKASEVRELNGLFSKLTDREREVLQYVLNGTPNRKAAESLRVSVRTIESRRAKVYKKLQTANVAQLVRLVDRLELLSKELKINDLSASMLEPVPSVA